MESTLYHLIHQWVKCLYKYTWTTSLSLMHTTVHLALSPHTRTPYSPSHPPHSHDCSPHPKALSFVDHTDEHTLTYLTATSHTMLHTVAVWCVWSNRATSSAHDVDWHTTLQSSQPSQSTRMRISRWLTAWWSTMWLCQTSWHRSLTVRAQADWWTQQWVWTQWWVWMSWWVRQTGVTHCATYLMVCEWAWWSMHCSWVRYRHIRYRW